MRRSVALVVAMILGAIPVMGAGTAWAQKSRQHSTDLVGAEEVPGPGDPNADGNATVSLSRASQRQICVDISWANVSGEDTNTSNDAVTAAHIHRAPEGEAGPIVFTIFSGEKSTSGSTSMCGSATSRLISAIQTHPEDFYVNLHSGEYPAGAIRGQLGD